MNYDKYLVDFIDGELPPEKEEKLFRVMNHDAELRAKMKLLLAVQSASKTHLDHVDVPQNATDRLFNSIGINLDRPSENEQLAEDSKSKSKKYFLWIPIIFSALFIGFLAGYLLRNDPQNYTEINRKSDNFNPGVYKNQFGNDFYNEKSSLGNINNVKIPKMAVNKDSKQKLSTIRLQDKIDNNPIESIHESRDVVINKEKPLMIASIDKINVETFKQTPIQHELMPIAYQPYNVSNQPHIEIGIGRGDFLFLRQEPVSNGLGFPISNTGVSGLYYFNDNIGIGFEFKYEQYALSYETTEPFSGYPVTTTNAIEGLSKSLVVQLQSSEMDVAPFGRFTAGLLESGYIFKAATGIKAEIYGNLSGTIALEYSNYMQTIYRQHFSQKIGFVYGLTYRF